MDARGANDSLDDDVTFVDSLARDVSRAREPAELAVLLEAVIARCFPNALRWATFSRHGLIHPQFRVTRRSDWTNPPDPWREEHRLPILHGGVLADVVYGTGVRVVRSIAPDADDPAADFLGDAAALIAIPAYDAGRPLNVGVWLFRDASTIDLAKLPLMATLANLLSRTTHAMLLRRQLSAALEAVEAEMEVVGSLQRAFLPAHLPSVPGVELSVHHQTARRAGGDYYDARLLDDGRTLAIFVADVSGHGAPSTVGLGIVHSMYQSLLEHSEADRSPGVLLQEMNRALTRHYTLGRGTFVTAFLALLELPARTLRYANAGHPSPRLKRSGDLNALPGTTSLPLGIDEDERYDTQSIELRQGDRLTLFTDGCFEVANAAGTMLGLDRLDGLIGSCESIDALRAALHRYAGTPVLTDDATIVTLRLTP
ncbi:MAG: PP2C family protein-serine/threonine phosphatase [Tepidisphaeraceae bacterium]